MRRRNTREPAEAYRSPVLTQIGTENELREEEAWLHNLLAVCHHALKDLHDTAGSDGKALIADLERVRENVQRRLSRLVPQE